MENIGAAGNKGGKIRSDCFVSLELTDKGGRVVDVKSRVKSLYGDSIAGLCNKILYFFGIEHARVEVEDAGALEAVIAARVEAAVKMCIDTKKDFLLDMLPQNDYESERDHLRRSRLYLPGNSPGFMINAGLHKPDGVILDLEDSVAPNKKFEARIMVRNALRSVNFYGAERMVRINQLPMGLEDLPFVIPHNVHVVLIPKCESPEDVKEVDARIREISPKHEVYIMPIIESALGVLRSYEIASASENVVALAIGLEDYTADIGAQRTNEGKESLLARSQVVNAARAAGVQPIDSVFSDVADMEALRACALESKSLGFEGMGCIHPRQIGVIHECHAPNKEELEKAKRIVEAFEEGEKKGLGVVAIGSKMIDAPVVKRARKIVELAELADRGG